MFTLKYTIHGIYGKVDFTKNITDESTVGLMDIIKDYSENSRYNNFDVSIYDSDTDECLGYTKEPIEGLPEDITNKDYFNMALINSINNVSSAVVGVSRYTNINANKISSAVKESIVNELNKTGLKTF